MRFENKRGQNEEKEKINTFYNLKNKFLYFFFLAGHLALHFKDDL